MKILSIILEVKSVKSKKITTLLIVIAIIVFTVLMLIALPKIFEFVVVLSQPSEEELAECDYYQVAKKHMETDEKIKSKYGENLVLYVTRMESTMYPYENTGEAEVGFWIKGHGPKAIHLKYVDGNWLVVNNPLFSS